MANNEAAEAFFAIAGFVGMRVCGRICLCSILALRTSRFQFRYVFRVTLRRRLLLLLVSAELTLCLRFQLCTLHTPVTQVASDKLRIRSNKISNFRLGILTIIILFLNGSTERAFVMDTPKAFKHSAELREYWRLEKSRQRAKLKEKKA